MYNNILVPMALDHGIASATLDVAQALVSDGGKITALHVHEAPQGSVSAYLDEGVVQEAFDRAEAKLAERVKDMPGVTGMIVKGHSGRTIVDVAKQQKIDCIVIGSHKPGLVDFLLGSTAARVVRHANCAVHVVRNPT
ncbi:Nucleotide-binding universal stress protein, UspA family [Jannaschia faecimaris]|uniref:Nucleotide-binding universal stress protein, UspA family n=1 Tax=Jannaschia faecimaris TaxID=1244108 RepID=A0A1H3T7K8_9RHOB|nr:universal stress protein [Jannaschia faecimaris]SDZ45841.1 Nucleotide-binding universal stress protein, UspA family [Jannaschia faecimaris]